MKIDINKLREKYDDEQILDQIQDAFIEQGKDIKPPKKKSVFSRKSSKCEMINRRYVKIYKEKV